MTTHPLDSPGVDVISVRWDAPAASYRVDRPNWNGGKVVPLESVAELIAAAKDVDAGSGGCPCPTCERLRKALANVGAAK